MVGIPGWSSTPQQRRQKTLQALTAQVEALSRSNPVLMIVEDVHWSDPTSLEAFGRAVDRTASHRVLLIATFRPEFELPWIGQPHVTFLSINRKRRLDDIGFPIDAGGFSGACGKHHLQQRLQYLLQSFAAVLAGGLRIEAGYVAAAARSTLKFHGSS